jgi:hypothetical protein
MQPNQFINGSASLLNGCASDLISLFAVNDVFKHEHEVIVRCIEPYVQTLWSTHSY